MHYINGISLLNKTNEAQFITKNLALTPVVPARYLRRRSLFPHLPIRSPVRKPHNSPFESRMTDPLSPHVERNPQGKDKEADAGHGAKGPCVPIAVDPGVRVEGHEECDDG